MLIRFNPMTSLADVRTHDGALIGAVPNDTRGIAAAEDALTAYRCAAPDTEATQALRLRVARRIIVLAGGTPASAQRSGEVWESVVWRHQKVLRLTGAPAACWTLGLDTEEGEAAREHAA